MNSDGNGIDFQINFRLKGEFFLKNMDCTGLEEDRNGSPEN